jgi:hypothetical protein
MRKDQPKKQPERKSLVTAKIKPELMKEIEVKIISVGFGVGICQVRNRQAGKGLQ